MPTKSRPLPFKTPEEFVSYHETAVSILLRAKYKGREYTINQLVSVLDDDMHPWLATALKLKRNELASVEKTEPSPSLYAHAKRALQTGGYSAGAAEVLILRYPPPSPPQRRPRNHDHTLG